MKPDAPPPAAPGQGRKAYRPPRLVRFGAVRHLTQAGSNSGFETGMGMRMPSERRLKENIVRIGVHPFGFGIYLFDFGPALRAEYGGGRQMGVMADEVEAVFPGAVALHPGGFRVVDYGMLGIHGGRC